MEISRRLVTADRFITKNLVFQYKSVKHFSETLSWNLSVDLLLIVLFKLKNLGEAALYLNIEKAQVKSMNHLLSARRMHPWPGQKREHANQMKHVYYRQRSKK
jgi:hypothetical protein